MPRHGNFRIDPPEVGAHVEALAEFGRLADGGLFRPVYSPAWTQARERVALWYQEAGLEVRGNAVGNLFGRLEGTSRETASLCGSHFDSVRGGGRYDGALGVVTGLLALKTLRERFGPPRRALEAIALCEEEGSRFPAGMWGSRAIHGLVAPEDLERLRDEDGVTIGDAMREAGFDPREIASAHRRDVGGFLELHVEQGGILDEAGEDVGLVTAITGMYWLDVTVVGRTDHAGPTPMHLRKDAFQGAAEMAGAITRMAEEAGWPAVLTTGRWEVRPGSPNIIPGWVRFTVDLRHPEQPTKLALGAKVEEACRRIARERGLEVEISSLMEVPGSPMDGRLRGMIREQLEASGYRWREMISGAGHDSQLWAPRVPTAMIFVPSKDGRSHSPLEYTSAEQAARGIEIVTRTLHALAY